jgi:hypothetical protein
MFGKEHTDRLAKYHKELKSLYGVEDEETAAHLIGQSTLDDVYPIYENWKHWALSQNAGALMMAQELLQIDKVPTYEWNVYVAVETVTCHGKCK